MRKYPRRPCQWCEKRLDGFHKKFCNHSCHARWLAKHRRTTTGRYQTTKGYVLIYRPDHPAASSQGYVMEHRLVMEGAIGRALKATEVVHHKNGRRADNRLENLELLLKPRHDQMPKKRTGLAVVPCPHCNKPLYLTGRAMLAAVKVSGAMPGQA